MTLSITLNFLRLRSLLPNTVDVGRPGVEIVFHVLPRQLTECAMVHTQQLQRFVDLRQSITCWLLGCIALNLAL